ncbi:MAG: TIM-barrel domain-containing protein [Alloacidobacterium sp.]
MKTWLRRLQCLVLLVSACCSAQTQSISQPQYSVTIAPSDQPGAPPQLKLERQHETIFQIPIIAGLASSTSEEQLSNITYSLRKTSDDAYELTATAKSNLWTSRRFQWRFLSDHIEFQQFATGSGKLGRCYFLANGVSNRWDNGTTSGHAWDATIYADRYFAPNPNLADQSEFNIAMPQILGFSVGREESSEQDFRPERMAGTFAPPPLFLAFHLNSTWTGIGIGAKPGDYQFPALEYSGSRYAGASFYVDYMGYRTIDGDFASPVLTINMAYSPLDALRSYTAWLTANGFATDPVTKDVYWHHLPIFCGWAEQTVESVPQGGSANKLSTQANYEKWLATLEERGLPVGTVVIDDKWQQGYGSFDVDQQKWPDFKGFIAAQHAKGRHVVLWVPVADIDGLPPSLCVNYQGKCVIADVGKPEYEAFLRPRIRHLVQDLGVDGFKEDWVRSPAAPGLPLTGPATGIEFVRRFQSILYSETHKWKPDAMVETQTTNALFRESSDVIRLNDIWYASRNVPEMMRLRARMANITGWPLIDTDNASATNLKEWWNYMQAQPSIGIPALYFVTRTETTQETPSAADWTYLAVLWHRYIDGLKTRTPQ